MAKLARKLPETATVEVENIAKFCQNALKMTFRPKIVSESLALFLKRGWVAVVAAVVVMEWCVARGASEPKWPQNPGQNFAK